ncbi:clathrin adaptor complex small chain-domain-containing protein [Mrakia frigida]|uniref:clathrin adaptor complex small chain-domain-containing protein n=1 Tax=Mrakia frigida TaxID=29902 RepID=UPI003FCC0039
MILSVLIFNTTGVPRLSKFYTSTPPTVQRQLIAQIFKLVSDRPPGLCSFLDAPELRQGDGGSSSYEEDEDVRVIYRQFATLTFVFICDQAESELGVLDLIQVFVEALDRMFENVCELDLVFGFDEVHHTLAEIIQGGLVLETNINSISANVLATAKQRKLSASSASPLANLGGSGSSSGRGSSGGGRGRVPGRVGGGQNGWAGLVSGWGGGGRSW